MYVYRNGSQKSTGEKLEEYIDKDFDNKNVFKHFIHSFIRLLTGILMPNSCFKGLLSFHTLSKVNVLCKKKGFAKNKKWQLVRQLWSFQAGSILEVISLLSALWTTTRLWGNGKTSVGQRPIPWQTTGSLWERGKWQASACDWLLSWHCQPDNNLTLLLFFFFYNRRIPFLIASHPISQRPSHLQYGSALLWYNFFFCRELWWTASKWGPESHHQIIQVFFLHSTSWNYAPVICMLITQLKNATVIYQGYICILSQFILWLEFFCSCWKSLELSTWLQTQTLMELKVVDKNSFIIIFLECMF